MMADENVEGFTVEDFDGPYKWIDDLKNDPRELDQLSNHNRCYALTSAYVEEDAVLYWETAEDFVEAVPAVREAALTEGHVRAWAARNERYQTASLFVIDGSEVMGASFDIGTEGFEGTDVEVEVFSPAEIAEEVGIPLGETGPDRASSEPDRADSGPDRAGSGPVQTRIKVTPSDRGVVERMAQAMGLPMSKVFDVAVMEKARREGYV